MIRDEMACKDQHELVFLERYRHEELNEYIQQHMPQLRSAFQKCGYNLRYLPSHAGNLNEIADKTYYFNVFGEDVYEVFIGPILLRSRIIGTPFSKWIRIFLMIVQGSCGISLILKDIRRGHTISISNSLIVLALIGKKLSRLSLIMWLASHSLRLKGNGHYHPVPPYILIRSIVYS